MSECDVKPTCYGRYSQESISSGECNTCLYLPACVGETLRWKTPSVTHPNREDSQRQLNDLAMTQVKAVYAKDTQVGGTHYKDLPIQPVEYIHANAIGYFEGNVIKYVSRWRKKNGIADLEKAKHYIELLIELETRNA